ncbi:MAG: hypothetical protein IJ570_00585 [Prevotella sp.]|nr:hypothetical protein [Prevotella sp.]
MKKLFTLVMLMMLGIVGLKAQTAVFDFENNPENWPVGEGVNFADGNLNNPLTVGEVTLTNVQGNASQPARIMRANDGISALYVYKNGSIELSAAAGRALTKVEVTMKSNSFDLTPSNGTVEADVWTGNATTVLFTAAANRQMLKLVVTTADENDETVKPATEAFDVEAADIAAFNAVEDGKVVKLTLTDAQVNAYNSLTGVYYVEDATGATAFKGLTLTAGQKLNGYIIGTKSTDDQIDYMNDPAVAVEYQLTASTTDTFTAEDATLSSTLLAIPQACAQANYGKLVTLTNVTISGGGQNKTLTDAEGNTMKARDYLGVLPAGYQWPETAARFTGVVIYYMTGWFILPISEEAIEETAAEAPVVFDFTTADLRGYMGTAIGDEQSYIINETYTIGGVNLTVTAGSAPSRITAINNRGNCLALYKEYATLLFVAPEGKAITKIELGEAGNNAIALEASPAELEGAAWTGNAQAVRLLSTATTYLTSATVTLADASAETVELMPLVYTEAADIAAFNALEAGTYAKLTLTDAEVIGISADGYTTVFIQDTTGGTLLQYTSLNSVLQAGTKVNGTVYTVKRVASGNGQLKETVDTPQSELTATELEELSYIQGTLAELNVKENLGRVVKLTGVKFEATDDKKGTLTQGDASIEVNNGAANANQQLHAVEFAAGDVIENATVVGILNAVSASKNQILPLSITSEVVDGISTATHLSPAALHPYNLQGQRLQQLHRGINIVGGKKIIVR